MMKLEVPGGEKKVLLHCCCAPCSGAIIECLASNGITPVIFFSNSNISPREEYLKRKEEIVRYAALFGFEVVDDDYDHEAWLDDIKGLEAAPERGARCSKCFKFRLLRAARYAAEHEIKVLTTTLASSRWKNLQQVEEAGKWACSRVEGVEFWAQNWRKGGLQERRGEVIREQNFYNQTFCGCEFSKKGKMDNVEIERKFLTKGDFKEAATASFRIAQGYICQADGKSVRVRIKGERGFLTIKGAKTDGVAGFEWEKEISLSDARTLLGICGGGIIDKTRYIVPNSDGIHFWEVDEFHGDNDGLILAEIELGAVEESFDKPDWIGEEVTGDPHFYNSFLSKVPFKNWKNTI